MEPWSRSLLLLYITVTCCRTPLHVSGLFLSVPSMLMGLYDEQEVVPLAVLLCGDCYAAIA